MPENDNFRNVYEAEMDELSNSGCYVTRSFVILTDNLVLLGF
jgi:hypothetical protein